MNQSQLKYARERAERIKRDRQTAIRAKFAPVELPEKDRIAAIKRGDFTVKKSISRLNYVSDILTINGETTRDQKSQDAALLKLDSDYAKLMDELILGDNEKALELLKAFAEAV